VIQNLVCASNGERVTRLTPVYPDYNNTIIRWGREEVLEYLLNPRITYGEGREFLY
jgi:hypothetical protein